MPASTEAEALMEACEQFRPFQKSPVETVNSFEDTQIYLFLWKIPAIVVVGPLILRGKRMNHLMISIEI